MYESDRKRRFSDLFNTIKTSHLYRYVSNIYPALALENALLLIESLSNTSIAYFFVENVPSLVALEALPIILSPPLSYMEDIINTIRQDKKASRIAADKRDIEEDVKRYSDEFKSIWRTYSENLLNFKEDDPPIELVDAMYAMVANKIDHNKRENRRYLLEHDKELLKNLSDLIGRDITIKNIQYVNMSDDVLGKTNSLSIKINRHRNKIFGKIYINKDIKFEPDHDLALLHEAMHLNGESNEFIAEAAAIGLLEKINHDKMTGFDILLTLNKLYYAVTALNEKFDDPAAMYSELKRLNAPCFILDSFKKESLFLPLKYFLTSDTEKRKTLDYKKESLYTAKTYYISKLLNLW